jgi:hypothetical protein
VTLPVVCERKTKNGDKIHMHYRGTLAADGSQFDASRSPSTLHRPLRQLRYANQMLTRTHKATTGALPSSSSLVAARLSRGSCLPHRDAFEPDADR